MVIVPLTAMTRNRSKFLAQLAWKNCKQKLSRNFRPLFPRVKRLLAQIRQNVLIKWNFSKRSSKWKLILFKTGMPFFNYKKRISSSQQGNRGNYLHRKMSDLQGKQLQTWLVNILATLKFIEEVHKQCYFFGFWTLTQVNFLA